MIKKNPWQDAIDNSDCTLTMEKLQKCADDMKKAMNEPPHFTAWECKMCGQKGETETYKLVSQMKSFKDGVFVVCWPCRIK